MSETIQIGEFSIDPESIVDTPLVPAKQELVLEVREAQRKTAPKSGNDYIALQLDAVDFPGNVIFQSYFLTAKALGQRSSVISWKKFLDKTQLPFTTRVADLNNFRFKAVLKHVGFGDEAKAELEAVVGPA
jgi:hypothetical protein